MEKSDKVKCVECGKEINYIDSYTISTTIEFKKPLCESCYAEIVSSAIRAEIVSSAIRKAEELYLRKTQLLSLGLNTEQDDQELSKAIAIVNSVRKSHRISN